MISLKAEANKKLERAVMRGNAYMFVCALSEGASIGYKSGSFFGTACREGHLEIVEIFLRDYTFLKKGKLYHKELYNAPFHDGLNFALARGHTKIVDFLMSNPIYRKLPDLDRYIKEGMQWASEHNKVETLNYMLSRPDVSVNPDSWSEVAQSNLSKVLLMLDLEKTLDKKEQKKAFKI